MIGQTISHYKILEKLGEGGMGVVYKAEDTRLKRTVALKFLPPALTADPLAKERFIQEAQAASALEHPNICNIHEINETEDGQLYIVMAYYEGDTLKETIGSGKRAVGSRQLAVDRVIEIALQIATGLKEAHDKGIVHRDIKPANIMITDKGQVKIMDFGLAKLAGQIRLTRTGSTVGTAAYMSTEQIRGQEIDQRSDIFSLGVVLYELLTGRLPFAGEYEAAVSYAILNETPAAVRSIRPEVSMGLEKIVERCLRKDRGKRYQRSEELIADLHSVQLEHNAMSNRPAKSVKVWWLAGAAMLALLLLGVFLFYPRSVSPSRDLKSIAVLPFKNLSDSKEDEYFSDGITEDILTHLSKISDLHVISRTTIMQFKESKKTLREIGKELKVGVVLEGSVRHAGDRIRVSSQLIDSQSDRHLWAETYDREMKDVFAIQSDVAKRIAAALEARLSSDVKHRIEKKPTENTEAYQLYLKGRYFWNKRTAADLRKSVDYFNRAIEKDSSYALAYAGLANAYVILPLFEFSRKDYKNKARQFAAKALELDSTLAEAHCALGYQYQLSFDWKKAEYHYQRAIALEPNHPTAHQWYGGYLANTGWFDEAVAEGRLAVELDPLSQMINYQLGLTFFSMRRYDQAREQSQKGIDMDPVFPWNYYIRGLAAEMQGRFDEAIADYEKTKLLSHDDPTTLGEIGRALARAGRKAEALHMLTQLTDYHRQGFLVSYSIANVYYGLGDMERALEWLERSFEDGEGWLGSMLYDPLWDALRPHPRYRALLKKIGLEK